MECPACGYDLRGLRTGICPECGGGFDLDTAGATATEGAPGRGTIAAFITAAFWPLLITGWLHVMLVAARLVLGRWPSRFGADDPKNIAVVSDMHLLGLLGLILLPFTIIILVISWVRILYSTLRLAVLLAAVALLPWILFLLVMEADPAEVWVWFWD